MVITTTAGPRLQAPFYAAGAGVQGLALHRYLDPEFLPRFLDDVNHGRREELVRSQSWLQEDRFSRHGNDLPVMRLPIHRCFYLLSCEVCCAQPGQPPLDPGAISSAGFVIRRGPLDDKVQARRKIQGWKLRQGRPRGWSILDAEELDTREPDEYRYLLSRNLLSPRSPEPPYSGELSHPLFPLLVQGAGRKHTVLHGFIPLGGSLTLPFAEAGTAPARRNAQASADLQKELFWPFGRADFAVPVPLPSTPGALIESVAARSSVRPWSDQLTHQVLAGRPTFAFFHLLDVLVQRIKVGRPDSRAGEALDNLLHTLRFSRRQGNTRSRHTRLDEYIQQRQETLGPWLNDIRLELEKGTALLPEAYLSQRLPGLSSDIDFVLDEDQAESFRLVMAQQLDSDLQEVVMDLPVARFQQNRDDIYHARAFIRTLDECGHEHIHWGPVSTTFRVAAPADPEASRPHLIQLPELEDLKRGAAKGVAMLAPEKLAEKLESIKLDPEVSNKSGIGRPGISWIYSFSIPVVTICAMILLMILVSLLDIIFRWMPWVIVRIPIFSGLRSEESE